MKGLRQHAHESACKKTNIGGSGDKVVCGHCGRPGHSEDKCFKKHGPPPKITGGTHYETHTEAAPEAKPPPGPADHSFTGFMELLETANQPAGTYVTG